MPSCRAASFPGVTYSYTSLLIADERSAGEAIPTAAIIERFTYMYDADGTFVPLSDTIGLAETPVQITDDLMSASATGDVPLETTILDADWNPVGDPISAGTETFSAVFTGYGPLIRGQDVIGIDPDLLGAVVTPATSVQRYVNSGREATISVTFTGLFGTADLGAQGFVGIARLHLLGITLAQG